MTPEDRTAATAATAATVGPGEAPDDPDPDPDVASAGPALDVVDTATRERLFGADTGLDGATAARLRREARRTRGRIRWRLADAGHLSGVGDDPVRGVHGREARRDDPPCGRAAEREDPPPGGAERDDLDMRRNLSGRLDENVAFFEHIDALHERRLHSPSPRERQVATRALAEALHRVVVGYQVAVEPAHRPVMAARRADEWLGRTWDRLATRGPRRDAARCWWARDGRWVRLALALAACLLLAQNFLAAGAVLVTARSVASAVLYSPAAPVGVRRRLLGYDPGWASCVGTHLGDAAIVVGMGLGLHLDGHTEWGMAAVFAALFGLLARMARVASDHHAFRMPRLWLDRAATGVSLPLVAMAAAVAAPHGDGTVAGVPAVAVTVAVVTTVGVVEIVRTVYFALCRQRLFRRAVAADDGLVPDAIVAHTADGIVVNLSRAVGRPPVFDLDGATPRLRAMGDTPLPSRAPAARGRRERRGSRSGRR
jgi:hypothetical protein